MTFKTKIKSDEWQTPDWLFDLLNDRFCFDADAACTRDNDKVRAVIHEDDGTVFSGFKDGLKEKWGDRRIFCNPPFSQKKLWIEKMYNEVINGDCPLCVMLLPMCLDTISFNKYIHGTFCWEHLPYRVSFLDENNKPVKGNTSGTIIVYAWKPISRGEE